MKDKHKDEHKLVDTVAPLAGATGIALCPVCIPAAATFLSYIGLAGAVPFFPKLSMALLALGLVGFYMDYRKHGNTAPTMMLFAGGLTMYLGRYHYADNIIWITGILLILFGVIHNRNIIKSKKSCCSITK